MKTPNPTHRDYARHPALVECRRRLATIARSRSYLPEERWSSLPGSHLGCDNQRGSCSGFGTWGSWATSPDPTFTWSIISGTGRSIGARMLLTGRGRPGHEKFVPGTSWILGRFGTLEAAMAASRPLLEAARALDCGNWPSFSAPWAARSRFPGSSRMSAPRGLSIGCEFLPMRPPPGNGSVRRLPPGAGHSWKTRRDSTPLPERPPRERIVTPAKGDEVPIASARHAGDDVRPGRSECTAAGPIRPAKRALRARAR